MSSSSKSKHYDTKLIILWACLAVSFVIVVVFISLRQASAQMTIYADDPDLYIQCAQEENPDVVFDDIPEIKHNDKPHDHLLQPCLTGKRDDPGLAARLKSAIETANKQYTNLLGKKIRVITPEPEIYTTDGKNMPTIIISSAIVGLFAGLIIAAWLLVHLEAEKEMKDIWENHLFITSSGIPGLSCGLYQNLCEQSNIIRYDISSQDDDIICRDPVWFAVRQAAENHYSQEWHYAEPETTEHIVLICKKGVKVITYIHNPRNITASPEYIITPRQIQTLIKAFNRFQPVFYDWFDNRTSQLLGEKI